MTDTTPTPSCCTTTTCCDCASRLARLEKSTSWLRRGMLLLCAIFLLLIGIGIGQLSVKKEMPHESGGWSRAGGMPMRGPVENRGGKRGNNGMRGDPDAPHNNDGMRGDSDAPRNNDGNNRGAHGMRNNGQPAQQR